MSLGTDRGFGTYIPDSEVLQIPPLSSTLELLLVFGVLCVDSSPKSSTGVTSVSNFKFMVVYSLGIIHGVRNVTLGSSRCGILIHGIRF